MGTHLVSKNNIIAKRCHSSCLYVMQAAFAASHKICIRYLKREDSNVQLMYLGGVSVIGSVVVCVIMQKWSLPSTSLDWVLLIVIGQIIVRSCIA